MSTPWLVSLVRENPELYRLIYDWNMYPHRWAHPAWLESVPLAEPTLRLLESSPAGRLRLSRFYLKALGLTSQCWDLAEPNRRLALLPAPSLARLAAVTGATLYWSHLARIVSKPRRTALAQVIGTDAYTFALRHGRALTARSAPPDPENPGDPGPEILLAGWRTVHSGLGEDPAVQQRFRLKAPPDVPLTPSRLSPADAWTLLRTLTAEILSPLDRRCLS
jgi:hypothetical protein